MLRIYDLKCDYRRNPVGIDDIHPRFSWKLQSDKASVMQTGYRITIHDGARTIWDTGLVSSKRSVHIKYDGEPLRSRGFYTWQVEVRASAELHEEESALSETASFEMGLLSVDDWQAEWVEAEEATDPMTMMPAQYFRKSFIISKPVKHARLYQTAHGLYEFWINGERGTEDLYKPGFTMYYKRLQYQVYDVLPLLRSGENVWSVILADGWWRGVTGGDVRNNFGSTLAFLGQLELEYEDGSREVIISNDDFVTSTGGILQSDMKLGDVYDASLEPCGWKLPGFDASRWKNARISISAHTGRENLIASNSVPVRRMETLQGKALRDSEGSLVIDFGQNIAGNVKMTFHNLTKGQKVTVEFGEDFKDGAFYNRTVAHNTPIPGLERFQQVDYIAAGTGEETYEPLFSVFGFQYLRISGYEGEINAGDFEAYAIYSVLEETGEFDCSSKLVNQLVKNSRWSQKGNFLDVPTDCPTRERSPWTGDSQIYAKTAGWFAEVYPFFEKWMQDVAADQCENGKILNIAPNCMMMHDPVALKAQKESLAKAAAEAEKAKSDGDNSAPYDPMASIMANIYAPDGGYILDGSSGWGDTATITPWTMYLRYGDIRILKQQYASAKKWVDYMIANAKNKNELRASEPWYTENGGSDGQYVWDTRYQWGEWLEPDVPNVVMRGPDAFIKPDPEVPTAYLCYSSRLLSQMAAVLGNDADAAAYAYYSEQVKRVYNRYFIPDNGLIKDGRQAPQVRALAFGLCRDEVKTSVAARLNEMLVAGGYKLNTGFLSTAMLLNVLCDNGYSETAYRVLQQEECPGWLFNVIQGATTIPETWDGKLTHKESMNHYSYGAVCDFLFSRCAGIDWDESEPGFQKFVLRPVPDESMEYAEAKYNSPYGMIVSGWKRTKGKISYHFVIPCNTEALVTLPDGRNILVMSGTYDF